MAENKVADVIDIGKLIKKIYSKRKLFLYKVWPITFVVSCLYIICIPRYYTSELKLAPEMGGNDIGGTLGALASTLGVGMGNMESGDAIYPMLYPDILEDNGFVTNLFSIKVTSIDGEIDTDYYTYLRSYQKTAWWNHIKMWAKRVIKSVLPKSSTPSSGDNGKKWAPYWLTDEEESAAEAIRGNILISLNDKTGVITISSKAQDPLIAKILADSVTAHLQQFITNYRTNKARIDVNHYEELAANALLAYDKACKDYSQYVDANSNVVKSFYQTKIDNLSKDMQLKYSTYSSLMTQLELSKARLQENTPAFTQLKGAAVQVKPAGPKRMIFVLLMLVLATITTLVIVLRQDLTKNITVHRY